jgi:hypothetical protein
MLKDLDKSKLYYFASPYSHDNTFVRQARYEATIYIASELTKLGFRLLEPIAMCHEQSNRHNMPSGYDFWQTRDRGFIDVCDAVLVLTLPGWKKSKGVTDEIAYAKKHGLTVHKIDANKFITKSMWKQIH